MISEEVSESDVKEDSDDVFGWRKTCSSQSLLLKNIFSESKGKEKAKSPTLGSMDGDPTRYTV